MIRAGTTANGKVAWLLCAGCLAAIVLVGNSDLLLGKATPIWDAAAFYGPMFSLVADHSKAGHLLTWNPWMNGGSPDFTDPQVGSSSPILLAFGLLSSNFLHGFVAYWLSIWIFGGIGMLLLSRHLGVAAWAGLVTALGFTASGFVTGHGEHTTIVYTFSFLPWIIWRFDVALKRRSCWEMAVAGMLWGLSALGGYPALVILTPLFVGLWGLGRAWLPTDTFKDGDRPLVKRLLSLGIGLGIFCAIGIAVMSPPYLGFLVYAKGYTTRVGGVSREYSQALPLPPQAIATLASPFLYLLNSPPYSIWPETDVSMSSIYSGSLVLVAAMIALFRPQKWQLWIGAIVMFFLACSVGKHLPLRGLLYDFLLPTRYFRFPSLFSPFAMMGLFILASYGLLQIDASRAGGGDKAERGRFVLVSIVVFVASFLAYRSIMHTAHLPVDGIPHPLRVFTLVWISILSILFVWWTQVISSRLLVACLLLIAVYDSATAIQVSKATLYSRGPNSWWDIMVSKHESSLDLTANGLKRRLLPPDDLGYFQHDRNVVLKMPTLASYSGMVNPFFNSYVNDPILQQLAIGDRRIWFSPQPMWLPPSESAFSEYVRTSHALGVPPVVLHTPDAMMGCTNSTDKSLAAEATSWRQMARSASPIDVEVVRYSPNELAFRLNAEKDGWLLVTDRWAPHWHVKVNGHDAPNTGGNFIFRAVPVSRGENLVSFRYEPRGYIWLVSLSWGTVVLIILGECIRIARQWRRSSTWGWS
ncbi:MAG TPA: hypothetical protein VMT53_08080 [Terriglobales bacterium]|nr:hypothetical protein [Terriglobales bacterium]